MNYPVPDKYSPSQAPEYISVPGYRHELPLPKDRYATLLEFIEKFDHENFKRRQLNVPELTHKERMFMLTHEPPLLWDNQKFIRMHLPEPKTMTFTFFPSRTANKLSLFARTKTFFQNLL